MSALGKRLANSVPTGMHDDLAADLPATIAALRAATELPICVGFGLSTSQQVRQVGSLADGVVVGSAIVKALTDHGVDAALDLVRSLRRALDTPA